jgi:hypothetical protein
VTCCDHCIKGGRDCEVKEMGGACQACYDKKYKCEHTGHRKLETMWAIRGAALSDSEVEIVEDRKGKKRKAVSPVPPRKRQVTVKVEKAEKPKKSRAKVKEEKTREKVAEKPKASGSKPAGRRRVAPKSDAIILDSAEEDNDDEMEVDVESDVVPQPKRVRATTGECPTHF